MPEKVNPNQTFDKLVGKAAMPPLPHGEREKREEIEKGGRALLPRWSPLGDFGPHGDQNEFFGPLFFQSPHFLHFRPKNASKVSAATI